jgi:hypothetical protein
MKIKPLKFYEMHFVVSGSGEFPIDMLRYDNATPSSEEDSGIIERRGPRRVALRSRRVNDALPTAARWASFGWKVEGVYYEAADAQRARDNQPGAENSRFA